MTPKAIWPFEILALWVLPALLGQLLCTSGFGPAVIWATLAVLGAIGLVQVGMVGVACILAPLPGGAGRAGGGPPGLEP